jgi:hypothetical protein
MIDAGKAMKYLTNSSRPHLAASAHQCRVGAVLPPFVLTPRHVSSMSDLDADETSVDMLDREGTPDSDVIPYVATLQGLPGGASSRNVGQCL